MNDAKTFELTRPWRRGPHDGKGNMRLRPLAAKGMERALADFHSIEPVSPPAMLNHSAGSFWRESKVGRITFSYSDAGRMRAEARQSKDTWTGARSAVPLESGHGAIRLVRAR